VEETRPSALPRTSLTTSTFDFVDCLLCWPKTVGRRTEKTLNQFSVPITGKWQWQQEAGGWRGLVWLPPPPHICLCLRQLAGLSLLPRTGIPAPILEKPHVQTYTYAGTTFNGTSAFGAPNTSAIDHRPMAHLLAHNNNRLTTLKMCVKCETTSQNQQLHRQTMGQ